MTEPVITAVIDDFMNVAPEDRILHLGCGEGSVTRRLARLAHRGLAVGIDSSDDMVRLARRLSVAIENLMFVPGSAEEIPWQDEFFSKLLSFEPVTSRAAREIFRVVSPGGRALALAGSPDAAALFSAAGFGPVQARSIPDQSPPWIVEACKPVLK
jgi:trans-aconitate 2-methyltransferase